MVTRMSQLFLRTLREDSADAEVPSHRLLVRAGYIRRTAPGIYTWLPLGKQILDIVAQIVREEMDRIGAQEVLFPALLPREVYEASGRWTDYGPNLFRLQDRQGVDYILGPTHEELFTPRVKGEYARDLDDRLNTLDLGRTFTAADTLKNVVVKTRAPGAADWELLVVGVPGDREVDLKRIAGQLEPVEVMQADADDLAKQPELVRGYIGPQLLAGVGVRYVVDPRGVPGSAWVAGANNRGKHAAHVVRGR